MPYNPDEIIQDVASRNPDMPNPQKPKAPAGLFETKPLPSERSGAVSTRPDVEVPTEQISKMMSNGLRVKPEQERFLTPAFERLANTKTGKNIYLNNDSEGRFMSGRAKLLSETMQGYNQEVEKKTKELQSDQTLKMYLDYQNTINQYNEIAQKENITPADEIALDNLGKRLDNYENNEALLNKIKQGKEKSGELKLIAEEYQNANRAFKDYVKNDEEISAFTNFTQNVVPALKTVMGRTGEGGIKSATTNGFIQTFIGLAKTGGVFADIVGLSDETTDKIDQAGMYIASTIGADENKPEELIAEGIGSFVGSMLLTRGIGSAAKGFSRVASGSTITATNSFLTGFLQSFGDNYIQSINAGSDPKSAMFEATARASITGLSESILDDVKLLDNLTATPFNKALGKLSPDETIEQLFKGNKEVALNETKKLITGAIGETAEELFDLFGQVAIDNVKAEITTGSLEHDYWTKKAEEAWKTIYSTFASTLLATGPTALSNYNKNINKDIDYINSTLMEISSDEQTYQASKNVLGNLLSSGKIEQKQFDDLSQKIDIYRSAFSAIESLSDNDQTLTQKQETSLFSAIQNITNSGTKEQINSVTKSLFDISVASQTGQDLNPIVREAMKNIGDINSSIFSENVKKSMAKAFQIKETEKPAEEIKNEAQSSQILNQLMEQAKTAIPNPEITPMQKTKEFVDKKIQDNNEIIAKNDALNAQKPDFENNPALKDAWTKSFNSRVEQNQKLIEENDMLSKQKKTIEEKIEEEKVAEKEAAKAAVETVDEKQAKKQLGEIETKLASKDISMEEKAAVQKEKDQILQKYPALGIQQAKTPAPEVKKTPEPTRTPAPVPAPTPTPTPKPLPAPPLGNVKTTNPAPTETNPIVTKESQPQPQPQNRSARRVLNNEGVFASSESLQNGISEHISKNISPENNTVEQAIESTLARFDNEIKSQPDPVKARKAVIAATKKAFGKKARPLAMKKKREKNQAKPKGLDGLGEILDNIRKEEAAKKAEEKRQAAEKQGTPEKLIQKIDSIIGADGLLSLYAPNKVGPASDKLLNIRNAVNALFLQNSAAINSTLMAGLKNVFAGADLAQTTDQLRQQLYQIMSNEVAKHFQVKMPLLPTMLATTEDINDQTNLDNLMNNYILDLINDISSPYQDSKFPIGLYAIADKMASEARANPGRFMAKTKLVLNRIVDGENFENITEDEIELAEAAENAGGREAVPNNDNVPEANLIMAFHNAIEKKIKNQNNGRSSFNIRRVIQLMFNGFPNPYALIAYSKNVEAGLVPEIDPTTRGIIAEVGKVMEDFINRLAQEEGYGPAELFIISKNFEAIFSNKPRAHYEMTVKNNTVSMFSNNSADSVFKIKADLEKALYEAKTAIKQNRDRKDSFERIWLQLKNSTDVIQQINLIKELLFMYEEVGQDVPEISLLLEVFSPDQVGKVFNALSTSEESARSLVMFFTELLSPVEKFLQSGEFALLDVFISAYTKKSLPDASPTFGTGFYDKGSKKKKTTIQRQNVITSISDILNDVARKAQNGMIEAISKLPLNNPLRRFLSDRYQNMPIIFDQEFASLFTEGELAVIQNTLNGNDSRAYMQAKNLNRHQRTLLQIASFFPSLKYGNKTYQNAFFPSNKPKVKMHKVPRFIVKEDGIYLDENLAMPFDVDQHLANAANDKLTGDLNQPFYLSIINREISSLTIPKDQVQAWLPSWIRVVGNPGKYKVEFNKKNFDQEVRMRKMEYIEAKASQYLNFAGRKDRTGTAPASNLFSSVSIHTKVMRALVLADDLEKEVKKQLKALHKNEKEYPKGYRQFLENIAKDEILNYSNDVFAQFEANFVLNQFQVVQAFIAPLGSLIESEKGPGFFFDRVNSLIAPGIANGIDRNISYQVVDFGTKQVVNLPGGKTMEFDKLEGVEFILPEYSIETTIGTGVYNRNYENLKSATTGTNSDQSLAMHKNMSIVLSDEIVKANPMMADLRNYMRENRLDKVVTPGATKSKSEQKNAAIASTANGKTTISGGKTYEITSRSIMLQLPVNMAQEVNGQIRKNKQATQMLDQLFVAGGNNPQDDSVARSMISSAAKSLEANQAVAIMAINEFTQKIAELRAIAYEMSSGYTPEIGQKRLQKIEELKNVFQNYIDLMKDKVGKDGTAKFQRTLEKIKLNTTPENPVYNLETDVTSLHEIFNDIVRDSQSVWVSGGWHNIVPDVVASVTPLKFQRADGVFTGEVMINQQTANELGWAEGQKVLLQKNPFNNMATKLFATVKIGPVNGSSMAMPYEWVALTSSDYDADAVASLKMDPAYYANFINTVGKLGGKDAQEAANIGSFQRAAEIVFNTVKLNENGEAIPQNDLLKQYYVALSEFYAQQLLHEIERNHEQVANKMQIQSVTTEKFEEAGKKLGFTKEVKGVLSAGGQATRASDIQSSGAGIGIGASVNNTFYRMGLTGVSLPGASGAVVKIGNTSFRLGTGAKVDPVTGNKINPDGSSIIDRMSNMLQILVDSFKNNWAKYIGMDNNNIYHFQILNNAGVSEQDLLVIMNQPVMKLYSALRNNSRSPLMQNTYRSYNEEINYIREALKSIVLENNMNTSLLAEMGYVLKDGAYVFQQDQIDARVINADLIKPSYQSGAISNEELNLSQAVEVMKSLKNDTNAIAAQIEALKLLNKMAPMVNTLERWIKVRKKFQDGITNPSEIPVFIQEIQDLGIITKVGEDSVQRTAFEGAPLLPNQKAEIEREIEDVERKIARIQESNVLPLKMQLLGVSPETAIEFYRYKLRMLNATNVNGGTQSTFYVTDPFFAQQVDSFFMMVAQSSTAIPILKQNMQQVAIDAVAQISSKGSRTFAANELLNQAQLKSAKEVLLEEIYPDVFNEINEFERQSHLREVYQSISKVMSILIENRSNFPDNYFLKYLEFMASNPKPILGQDEAGNPYYSNEFYFYSDNALVPVFDTENVKPISEAVSSLVSKLPQSYQEALSNPGTTIDDIKDLMASEPINAADYNLSQLSLEGILGMIVLNNKYGQFPMNIVMYNGMVYDAGSGMPFAFTYKTQKLMSVSDENYEAPDEVYNDNDDLAAAQTAIHSLAGLYGGFFDDGFNLVQTYMNQIEMYLDGHGGASALSPKYKQTKEANAALGLAGKANLLDPQKVVEGMSQLRDLLFQPISMPQTDGELTYIAETTLSELFRSGITNDAMDLVIQTIIDGNFNTIYGMYVLLGAQNYNQFAEYMPFMNYTTNQEIVGKQTEAIMSNKMELSPITLALNNPRQTRQIAYDVVQNSTIEEEIGVYESFVHTVDPSGNVILFKRVNVNKGAYSKFEASIGTAKKETKSNYVPETYFYVPIGYYEPGKEGDYLIIQEAKESQLEVLSSLDISAFTAEGMMRMVSGIINSEPFFSNEEVAVVDLVKLQEEISAMVGGVDFKRNQVKRMSFKDIQTALRNKMLTQKLRSRFGPAVTRLEANLKALLNFVNGIKIVDGANSTMNIAPGTKKFINNFYGTIEKSTYNTEEFDPLKNKETIAKEGTKTIRPFRYTAISALNRMARQTLTEFTIGEYFSKRGGIPTTFAQAVKGLMSEINADPNYNAVTKLLLNKIGDHKIVMLSKLEFEQKEAQLFGSIGMAAAFIDGDTIYMNKDDNMDLVETPEQLLHEAVHALTQQLYVTDPSFKQEINEMVQVVKSHRQTVDMWGTLVPEDVYDLFVDTVMDEQDMEVAANEFMAMALSTRNGHVFSLLRQIPAGKTMPQQVSKSLWGRLVFNIFKRLSLNQNNTSAPAEAQSLLNRFAVAMDTYYDRMGSSMTYSPVTTAQGQVLIKNGIPYTSAGTMIDHYLSTFGKNFYEIIQEFYRSQTGNYLTNTDLAQDEVERSEIEFIATLSIDALTNPSSAVFLQNYITQVSPRARQFAQNFQIGMEPEYEVKSQWMFGNDYEIADRITAISYKPGSSLLDPGGAVVHYVHADGIPEIEEAIEANLRNSDLFQATGQANTPLNLGPPAMAIMRAGVQAYLRETQGDIVKELNIIRVTQAGTIVSQEVDFDVVRPYVIDMLNRHANQYKAQNVRFATEMELQAGLIPQVNQSSTGDILQSNSLADRNAKAAEMYNQIMAYAEKQLKKNDDYNDFEKNSAVTSGLNILKNFIYKAITQEYKSLTRGDIIQMHTTAELLREKQIIDEVTYNWFMQEAMLLSEGIDVRKAVSSIRERANKPNAIKDLEVNLLKMFDMIFQSPFGWRINKKEISDMLHELSKGTDRMLAEARIDSMRSEALWQRMIGEKKSTLQKLLPGRKRMSEQAEMAIMNLMGTFDPVQKIWYFKERADFYAQYPTGPQADYYEFVMSKTQKLLTDITNATGGNNLLVNSSELYEFMERDPQTGEYYISKIPMPASGMRYRSQWRDWFNVESGTPEPISDYVLQTQMNVFGYVNVSYKLKSYPIETMSLKDWDKKIGGLVARGELTEAEAKNIGIELSKIAQEKPSEFKNNNWIRLSKHIGLKTFREGEGIGSKDKGISRDLNHNFQRMLEEAHAVRVGNRANMYLHAMTYVIDETIGKSPEGYVHQSIDMKDYITKFVLTKYFKESKAPAGKISKTVNSVVGNITDYIIFQALGFNLKAQIIDTADVIGVIVDSGDLKRSLKGVKNAFQFLSKATEDEKNKIARFFEAFNQAENIKRAFALDNAYFGTGIYKNAGTQFADAVLSKAYAIYKVNDFIRLMVVVGDEIGHERMTRIIEYVKNGTEISKEDKMAVSNAMDRYIASLGQMTSATSVRHSNLIMRNMATFKLWMMPNFKRKFGPIGTKVGSHQPLPVWNYQAQKLRLAADDASNRLFGKRLMKEDSRMRTTEALNSYSTWDKTKANFAAIYNATVLISSLISLYELYTDDDEKDKWKSYFKNTELAMKYGDMRYKALMGLVLMSAIGANPSVILMGFTALDYISNFAKDVFKPVPKGTGKGNFAPKYIDEKRRREWGVAGAKSFELMMKYTPIGTVARNTGDLFGYEPYYTDEFNRAKEKWYKKH